jgi:hypothetical protein
MTSMKDADTERAWEEGTSRYTRLSVRDFQRVVGLAAPARDAILGECRQRNSRERPVYIAASRDLQNARIMLSPGVFFLIANVGTCRKFPPVDRVTRRNLIWNTTSRQ